MEKRLFLILIYILIGIVAYSQNYFSKFYNINTKADNIKSNGGTAVRQTSKGYIISGEAYRTNNRNPDFMLLHTDKEGKMLWKRRVDSLTWGAYSNIEVLNDTIFVFISNLDKKPYSVFIQKYDINGNFIKQIEFAKDIDFPVSGAICLLHDNKISAVVNNRNISKLDTAYFYVFDKELNLLQRFNHSDGYGQAATLSLKNTLDSNYIITNIGFTSYPITKVHAFDKKGKKINTTEFPSENVPDIGASDGIVTKDSAYVTAIRKDYPMNFDTFNYPIALHKIDKTGKIAWQYTFFSPYYDSRDLVNLFTTKNGDIVGVGSANFPKDDPQFTKPGGWVFRVSPEGKLLWQRQIADLTTPIISSYLYNGVELDNGDLLFTGYQFNQIDTDIWLLKTDSKGCTITCDNKQVIKTKEALTEDRQNMLNVYPNPFVSSLSYSIDDELYAQFANLDIKITNILGETILQKKIIDAKGSIDLSTMASGFYNFQLINIEKSNIIISKKIIKI